MNKDLHFVAHARKKIFDDIQRLVATFYDDIQAAKEVVTPNPEDDLTIKAAITGFSYHCPLEDWRRGHFDFVRTRIDRDYSRQELLEYGDNGENIKLFFALSLGFLLGIYESGDLNDEDFKRVELQIPGIIMHHLSRLTDHKF